MSIYIPKILLITLIVATSFSVGAVEVFEKKDQQGEVEFSDQPTAGAKEIEVDPNVVKVTPVESTPSAATTSEPRTASDGAEDEVIHSGVADDYGYDDERLRRENREREGFDANEETVRQPARQETREGARHEGGQGRR